MKTKHLLFASILLVIASTGFAQGMGPMSFGFDPIVADDGTVLTLRSDGDHDHEPGSGPFHGEGMDLIAVDPAGSIAWTFEAGGGIHDLEIAGDLVIVAIVDGDNYGWWDGIDNEQSSRVVALTLAAGTVAWELELEEVVRSLEATSDRIYAVSGAHGQMQGGSIGRSTGHPGHGRNGPGSGPGTGPGNGSGDGVNERTLFAIGLDGSLLWTLPLN